MRRRQPKQSTLDTALEERFRRRDDVSWDRWKNEPCTELQLQRLEQLATDFTEITEKEKATILGMVKAARAAMGTPKAMTKLRAYDLIGEIGGKIADRRGGIAPPPRHAAAPRPAPAPAVDDPQEHRRDLFD